MRKCIVLTILLLLLLNSVKCFSQNDRVVDSLSLLLKKKKVDKLKVNNDIAEYYLAKNDSILIQYVQRGLSSDDILPSGQTVRAYEILGKYYSQNFQNHKAIKQYHTALSLAVDNLKKAELSIEIAITQVRLEDVIQALEYLRQAKSYLIRDESDTLWYRLYYNEGLCYFYIDDFELAHLRWKKALRYAEGINSDEYKAQVNAMLGEVNLYRNEYLESLQYLNESINLLSGDSVTSAYALALLNLGHLYKLNELYSDAYQFFNVSGIIYELLDIKLNYAKVLVEKGKINIINNNLRKAFEQFNEAKTLFSGTNCKHGWADANIGIAACYRKNGDFNQAIQHLQDVKQSACDNYSNLLKAGMYLEYGYFYYDKGQLDSALFYAETAFKLFNISKDNRNLILVYSLLSDINYGSKDYKSSIDHYRKAVDIRNSIFNVINSEDYHLLISKYELERKETIIEALTKEKEFRDKTLKESKATIERQNAFIILGLVILAFVGILVFVLVGFIHQIRTANKKLQKSNFQIAQQKEEMETQKQHLEDVNIELERLSIIARETDNAVKVMNAVGKIEWVNEGYTRLYGFKIDELQHIEHMNLLGAESNIDINSLVSVWYGDKKPITFECLNKKKNGADIWVQTTLTPVTNSDGKIIQMIAIDSDISRLKKAESQVKAKNHDITSSITYAKRIQEAIMSPTDLLKEFYPKSFIYYKPKSIVSGDFYWFNKKHDRIVVVCADSTGHGVPGAFMSLLGISFLNKIVNEKGFVSPAIILNRMRANIINHLHHSKNDVVAGDGMDMSVISIDRRSNTLEYAGAMNPIYIIRDNDLIELKPDRMPVGFFDNEDRPFSSTSLALKDKDHIYMFTDGYYDQFGGANGSKLKPARFKDLLKSCYGKPADDQREIIGQFFSKWKGGHQQVDDILVMGLVVE